MSKPVNPDAFPHPAWDTARVDCDGMDLRDYFAAKAMQVLLEDANMRVYNEEDIAADAYSVADAMLAEREKQP